VTALPDSSEQGLSQAEAARRLSQYGRNRLPDAKPEPFFSRLGRQFRSPLIYILAVALAVDSIVWVREGAEGWPLETIVISLILILNAALGIWQEYKAEDALAHLKALTVPRVWTMRDGEWRETPIEELVPGDLVRIESGDRVPADGRLTSGYLEIDESMLTGESLPVAKDPGGEIHSGTLITQGTAHFAVERTGPESSLGKLASMLTAVKAEPSPLERRLETFGHRIARWVAFIAVALFVQGVVTGGLENLERSLLLAVALAVAVVPEGLPAVLSVTLALGVERMAKRNAVVRKLASVESLGSITVIATDKTGTLTENRMHVRELDSPDRREALRAMTIANDAEGSMGDAVDVALLEYAQSQNVDTEAVRRQYRRIESLAFDASRRYMRVTVDREGRRTSYWKGAPEVLLDLCRPPDADAWREKVKAQAAQGLRTLALASGEDGAPNFLGLLSLWDPPRAEVPAAIRAAQDAGIRVVMVTGDHPATALSIASKVGFDRPRLAESVENVGDANVLARVRPEHKLALVESLQRDGEIVAMTGDGVNDAPALKKSNVGIAMGQRGSDVSREVADLVLLDDNFRTIVAAVEEGRSIYANIQKFIRFLLSTNLSELVVVALGVILVAALGLKDSSGQALLPLTAVQILWINLVTDGIPALALALDRNPGMLREKPRPPDSPLLDRQSLEFILAVGTLKGLWGLGLLSMSHFAAWEPEYARTVLFHFMAIGQLFFVYAARHTWLRPEPNRVLHAAVGLEIALQLAIGTIPAARAAFGLRPLDAVGWAVVFASALIVLGIAELAAGLLWRRPALRPA
jgi:Ca2+-transporting ATPase